MYLRRLTRRDARLFGGLLAAGRFRDARPFVCARAVCGPDGGRVFADAADVMDAPAVWVDAASDEILRLLMERNGR